MAAGCRRSTASPCSRPLRPPGPARSASRPDVMLRGQHPAEVAWTQLSDELAPLARDPRRCVELAYARLLGRSPTSEEARIWIQRLERRVDPSCLARALARSAELLDPK